MFQKEFEFFRNRAAVFKERVRETIYPEYHPVECRFAVSAEPVRFENRVELDYKPIAPGEKWGDSWESAWFHITGIVPEHFSGQEIALLFNAGGEALIFDGSGVPLHGLTGNSHFADKYTKERFLLKDKNAGDKIDIWIEAAANDLPGLVFWPVFGQTVISPEPPRDSLPGGWTGVLWQYLTVKRGICTLTLKCLFPLLTACRNRISAGDAGAKS